MRDEVLALAVDSIGIDQATRSLSKMSQSIRNTGTVATSASRKIGTGFDKSTRSAKRTDAAVIKLKKSSRSLGSSFSGLKSGGVAAFAGIAAGVAVVTAGIRTLTSALSKSVEAFADEEQSVIAVVGALSNLNEFSRENVEILKAQSGELQRTTAFGNTEIETVQRRLLAFGATTDNVEELTLAVLNLSTAMGKKLRSVTDAVGRAIDGNAASLKTFGITVDITKPKAEALAEAIDLMNKRFGGRAVLQGKSFTGQMVILKNSYEDFLKVIGQTATVLTPTFQKLSEFFQGINSQFLKQDLSVFSAAQGIDKLTGKVIELQKVQAKRPFDKSSFLDLFEIQAAQFITSQDIQDLQASIKFTVAKGTDKEIREFVRSFSNLQFRVKAAGLDDIDKELNELFNKFFLDQVEIRIIANADDAREELVKFAKEFKTGKISEIEVKPLVDKDEKERTRVELEQFFEDLKKGAIVPIKVDTNERDAIEAAEKLARLTGGASARIIEEELGSIGFDALQNSIGAAFSSIVGGAQSFSSSMKQIFQSMVDALIAELARLAAIFVFKKILQIANGGVPIGKVSPILDDLPIQEVVQPLTVTMQDIPTLHLPEIDVSNLDMQNIVQPVSITIDDIPSLQLPDVVVSALKAQDIIQPVNVSADHITNLTLDKIRIADLPVQKLTQPVDISSSIMKTQSLGSLATNSGQSAPFASFGRVTPLSSRIESIIPSQKIIREGPLVNIEKLEALGDASLARGLTSGPLGREIARAIKQKRL